MMSGAPGARHGRLPVRCPYLQSNAVRSPEVGREAPGTRPRQVRQEVCLRRAGDEPVVGSKAFPKFLAALTSHPSPVLLDFGPGHRHQRRVLRRASGLQAVHRRPRLRSRPPHARRHARCAARASSTRASVMRTPALTASCAGTSSISWTRPRRRRWPGRSSAWCGPGAPSWASSAPRPRPTTCRSRSTRSSTTTISATASIPGLAA